MKATLLKDRGRDKATRRTTALLFLLCVTLFAGACSGGEEKTEGARGGAGTAEAAEAQPVRVTTASAEAREVPAYLEATGSLAAQEESNVAPETSGQVIATPVDVGAFVGQGAVIARLDDRDARLRLQQAQSGVAQAQAGVRQAEVQLGLTQGGRFDVNANPQVRAAQAARESADAAARLSEANLRRYAALVETGDVARSVYDQYRTQAETARAAANSARQQYEAAINAARGSNQGIATAQTAVESARAQVGITQKAVDDAIVRAPFAGYISARPVAPGEYVTPASIIVTLVRTNPVKLLLQIPEADAGRARQGQRVSAQVSSYPDQQFAGTITAVNPSVDPTSRVLTVEVSIENDRGLLRPGMFATARVLQSEGVRGVFVPRPAVVTNPNTNSSSVYVVERDAANEGGEVARLRVVQVGEAEGDTIRIISGLNGDETLVTDNQEALYDGAQIRR